MKNPFWGAIIYEKKGDGTLNGLWKNNGLPNGTIVNEIARKNDDNPQSIDGTYTVCWIEETNRAIIGTLTVRVIENNCAFSFEWRNRKGITIFRGIGMPIGEQNLSVTYWDSNVSITLNSQ